MKCELLHEMEVVESIASEALLSQCVKRDGRTFAPIGTVLDDPDCWRIVAMGNARPADDECAETVIRTPVQQAKAEHAAERLSKGIHPDDFGRYDRGELLGYDANGNDIPGPNAIAEADEEGE